MTTKQLNPRREGAGCHRQPRSDDAAATAGAAAMPGLGGRLRFTCAAPRPRAGHPAAAATAAPRARGAARRRGRRGAAVLAAAPSTCFALAAASVGAQVGTRRVGVGVIPCPRRRWRSASTLDFAGCAAPALAPAAEPRVPAPRRRGRPGSLRSWGCASCASPASPFAPRHRAAGGSSRHPCPAPTSRPTPGPLHPRALPHSGAVKEENALHTPWNGRAPQSPTRQTLRRCPLVCREVWAWSRSRFLII